MDQHQRPIPGLAPSWKLAAPDTWEFKLRDAKLHNGEAFTADDMLFTLDRVPKVPDSPRSFAVYTKPVVAAEAVDPHTIRMRTQGMFPLLPIYMASVAVLNRKADESMATEDFSGGRAAIGTGPFRFVACRPGDGVEMERFDGYWDDKPAWQHVDYRFITNDASRTAALLAGDVDFIDFVPTTDLANLRTDPKVKLWKQLVLRSIFLGLDQSRDGPSPFVFGPGGEKMWTRIGVQTEVGPLPWTSYVSQANKQAFSAFLFGWGTATAENSDALIAQAVGTAGDIAREKLLQQAMQMAMGDVALIPLHIQTKIWATRANLTYVPTVGEELRPVDVRPAK